MKQYRMPGWFCAVFVLVMLAVCCVIAFCAVEQVSLRFQAEDVTRSLDTSRQRERKQQYEYDQVTVDLPAAQAELDAAQPMADAALAAVADLKAQRTTPREENAALTQQLEAAQAEAQQAQARLEALQEEVVGLQAQATLLRELLEGLQAP